MLDVQSKWIKIQAYCNKYSEGYDAVYKLIHRGYLKDGLHYRKRRNRIYINEPRLQAWIESGN